MRQAAGACGLLKKHFARGKEDMKWKERGWKPSSDLLAVKLRFLMEATAAK